MKGEERSWLFWTLKLPPFAELPQVKAMNLKNIVIYSFYYRFSIKPERWTKEDNKTQLFIQKTVYFEEHTIH